jgi:hypothetical protein
VAMRSMLLTTVAAAALGVLSFRAGAQDTNPNFYRHNAPPASETSRAPAVQPKGGPPERAGRSGAEPTQTGTAEHELKQKRGAQKEMKSQPASPAKAASDNNATRQNHERGPAQNPSDSKQPATKSGEVVKQRAQGATGGEKRKAVTGEAKATPKGAMRSPTPGSDEPQNKALKGSRGPIAGQGNTQSPNKEAIQGKTNNRSAATGHGIEQMRGTAVRLNARQQTEIVTALRNEPVQRVDRVDFSLTAGTIVPAYMALNPLPARIVEIVPQYRGYDFVMARDEIVIIEPRTRRIVTVLHGEGRSAATAHTRNPAHQHLQLTGEQRQLVRRDLMTSEGASIGSLGVGERVPADVSLLSIPEDILSEVPVIGPYRYFVTGDEVVLVAPDTREVVEIIE